MKRIFCFSTILSRLIIPGAVIVFFIPGRGWSQALPQYVYYVPLPEDQIYHSFKAIATATQTELNTVVSIVPSTSGQIIYYDQWEDGYEANIINPSSATTKIWGDNNPANGIPPGYTTDIMVAGKPIVLYNKVLTQPRNGNNVLYDGGDKIVSNRPLSFARSCWPTTPGSVLADAVEFMNTATWGTHFYIPIGTNIASNQMFNYTSMLIMGKQNGTNLSIVNNGSTLTPTINEGQSFQLDNIYAGATVTSSNYPVQVDLITGRIGSTYECRWFSVLPDALWDKSYYSPVGTTSTSAPSVVYLYAPSSTTVSYTTQTISGTVVIPANGTTSVTMPNSGAHFFANSNFYAVGAMDAGPAPNNQTWDWGYTLEPESFLTNSIYCGWGPGCIANPFYSTSPPYGPAKPPYNGSPVWVCAVTPNTTTVAYVDLDGNDSTGALTDINGKKYDYTVTLAPFQMARLYNNSTNDQTGMHVYTVDGTNISSAWGEDPLTAGPGNPFLDAGITLAPDLDLKVYKKWRLTTDVNGNHLADAGDVITFSIYLYNQTLQTFVITNVLDNLPSDFIYVANSTKYNTTAIPDNSVPPAATAFPLDESGYATGVILPTHKDSITYQVTVKSPIAHISAVNTAIMTDNYGEILTAQITVPLNQTNIATACNLNFTDASHNTVTTYAPGTTSIYFRLNDYDQNINTSVVDHAQITVKVNGGATDQETVILTEASANSSFFDGSIAVSSIPAVPGDNIISAGSGDNLSASFTDLYFPETCNANAIITTPTISKPLYLQDPSDNSSTVLNRTNPSNPVDNVTSYAPLLSSSSGLATIAHAATTSATNTSTSSLTFAHTPGSGSNRRLLVGIALGATSASGTAGTTNPANGGVTFAGTAMTQLGTAIPTTNQGVRIYLYYLNNPQSGSGNVVITLAQTSSIVAGASTFTGVDLSTVPSFVSNTNNGSATATLSLTGGTGNLAYSICGFDYGSNVQSISSIGSGQTALMIGNIIYVSGGVSTKPAPGSTTMSYTQGDPTPQEWAIGGVSLNPATIAAPGSVTFTQSPSMCSALSIPSGGSISASIYLTNVSGTIPASPNISASLGYGTGTPTPFPVTLAASYVSSTGLLSYSGTTTTGLSVPAGSPIVLTCTNNLTSTFRIAYSSSTYPSQIDLPVSGAIKVASINVYDNAYPAGSVITGQFNGTTVYPRVVVTDPFGSTDINGVTLVIKAPGGQTSTVPMVLASSNTTACQRTYEYKWESPADTGNYLLTATAMEGTEGTITSTASVNFRLTYQDTGTPASIWFTTTPTDSTTVYNPNDQICMRVKDYDMNLNSGSIEHVNVILSQSNCSTGDQETVTLTETGPNTGIFYGCIPSSSTVVGAPGNGTLYACPGASLHVTYTDPNDPTDVVSTNAVVTNPTSSINISKQLISPASPNVLLNSQVSWQIVVSNNGNTTDNSVNVTDNYPPGCLTYVSASPSPTVTASGSLSWNTAGLGLGSGFPPGGIKVITVTFNATGSTGCAPATNSTGVTAIDNIPNTRTASATNSINIVNPSISITKTKTSPAGAIYIGDNVTYSIVVTCTGNVSAATVPLTDQYSSYNLLYQSYTNSPGNSAPVVSPGELYWSNIGPIPVGGSVYITTTFKAIAGSSGYSVGNTAYDQNAIDGSGNPIPLVSATANITILNIPVAVNDTVATLVSTAVTGNVLTNDYDNDGLQLHIGTTGTFATTHGSITINADGTYTYTPTAGYTGTDTYTYSACDPIPKCVTAILTIFIYPCIGPPGRPGNVH